MPDPGPSVVSRILRLLSAEPSYDEKAPLQRDDDRGERADELERKFSQRDEAFFWTWQYPGQW